MSTKTYDKKTAAFAGFLIQNIPADLDEETMDGWMQNPKALKKLLAGLVLLESQKKSSKFERRSKPILIPATSERLTKDMFADSSWVGRDDRIDTWFSAVQPARTGMIANLVYPFGDWHGEELARAIIAEREADQHDLGEMLIAAGHTVSLAHVEEFIWRRRVRQHGEVWRHSRLMFLVETLDRAGIPVVLCRARLRSGFWSLSFFDLDAEERFGSCDLVVLPKADTSKF